MFMSFYCLWSVCSYMVAVDCLHCHMVANQEAVLARCRQCVYLPLFSEVKFILWLHFCALSSFCMSFFFRVILYKFLINKIITKSLEIHLSPWSCMYWAVNQQNIYNFHLFSEQNYNYYIGNTKSHQDSGAIMLLSVWYPAPSESVNSRCDVAICL